MSDPQIEANELYESRDEFEHLLDMVPDGCVPEMGVRAVAFIDENGETRFSYQVHGDVPNSKAIGLMEMAKMQWYHDYNLHDNLFEEE